MMKFTAANLELPGIAHGFFGRKGGVSEGIFASLNCGPGSDDDPAKVAENRRLAVAALSGGAEAQLATVYQVHGNTAVTVHEPWPQDGRPKADAMVTDAQGIALGILTADCAPVLFADPDAGVIGAAHAGWQGALAGITDAAIVLMESIGAQRTRIRAAVGPCISQEAYEVGPEFQPRFVAADPVNGQFFTPGKRADHWQFDLPGYVAHRLRTAGLEQVHVVPACTYTLEDAFYSYRRCTHRHEKDNGRQLSAIMLAG
jgi:polyphenol oxidase